MLSHCVIFSLFVISAHSSEDDRPLVETSLGKIRGYLKKSYKGSVFSAFEGIPYAKPPVGDLRFQAPHDIEPWSGTLNATDIHLCIQLQRNRPAPATVGDEDCLYVNVYVPREKPVANENLDVIVNIHGGAFVVGGPPMVGPGFLMDRNIVYVNLSYRLSVLGFLYTEDATVSGNNGLKDQVLALKWVGNHIAKFGGNPKCLTIIGASAGATSVHLHYFSPMSKGLYHRGISQSGNALAPGTIQNAPLKQAFKLANATGCPTTTTKELVNCFKEKPAEELIVKSRLLPPCPKILMTAFGPVMEKNAKDAFMPDYPYDLLLNSKFFDVPWMGSITTDEGLLGLSLLENKLDPLINDWNAIVPYLAAFYLTVDTDKQEEVSQKLKHFYFGNETISFDNVKILIRMLGDRSHVLSMEQATRLQAEKGTSPIWAFQYGYKSDLARILSSAKNSSWEVAHGEGNILLYSFSLGNITLNQNELSVNDERIKELQLDIVTSFAKTGKPQVNCVENWEHIAGNFADYRYLYIGNDGVKVNITKELAPTEFWQSLPILENAKRHLSKY